MENKKEESQSFVVDYEEIKGLILACSDKYYVTDPEFCDIEVEGAIPSTLSPTEAIKKLKDIAIQIRKQKYLNRVSVGVRVASHTVLRSVCKVGVAGNQLVVEAKKELKGYTESLVGPMIVSEHYFVKSIVLDAQEVDPEIVEDIHSDTKEMDVEKVEIVIRVDTSSPLSLGYTFSGYDKGCDVRTFDNAFKKLTSQPAVYLDPRDGIQEIHLSVVIPEVRAFYTWRAFKHKKFRKYNPRQYCYFTLYIVGFAPVGEVSINLRRKFSVTDDPYGKIYKGPVVRKGRVTCNVKKTRHKYKYCREMAKPSKPSPMTPARMLVVHIQDYKDNSKEIASRAYSTEKVRKSVKVVETYEIEGVLISTVNTCVEYKLRDSVIGEVYEDDCGEGEEYEVYDD